MKLIKTIALTLMTALILTSSSSPKDKDDHTLVALWKEYYAAESADKPKTQEHIKVDVNKCTGCRLCYELCPTGSYEMTEDGAVDVIMAYIKAMSGC